MSLPILVQAQERSEFHAVLLKEGIHIDSLRTITIHPSSQNIHIDQIRSLRTYLFHAGSLSRQIVFYSFQNATIESQNALLKLLEETGPKYRFALQVDSIYAVLPTIRSRCRVINAKKTSARLRASNNKLENFTDKLFKRTTTVTKKDEAEIMILELLDLLCVRLRDNEFWAVEAVKNTLSVLHLLQHNNLNPQLAVDQCILNTFYLQKPA